MFVRRKKSGCYEYLQIVHNERTDGRVKQRLIATLERLEVLRETGYTCALKYKELWMVERIVRRALEFRLAGRGWQVERQRLRDNLDALEEVTVRTRGQTS